MSEWKKVKLGEIASSIQTGPFGSQLHQSDYSDEGTPVVMPKDIINGHIDEATIARVEKHHVDRLVRHKITEGDIIYARRGDVGKCAYIVDNQNGWLCGTGCLKVTIDRAKAIPKFVFFQLQKRETIGWVEKHAIGATMLNLNTSILSEVPIELPSLLIQNRVVEILSRYDTLIENYQKQIKLLEEAAQRLYKEWFVDLRFPGHEDVKMVDGLPEGWERKTAQDFFTMSIGKTPPRAEKEWFSTNAKDVPWVSISDMKDVMFVNETSEKLTKEACEKFNVRIVPEGTILLSFKLTVGRVSISDIPVCTNEAIAHFVKDGTNWREYTLLYLRNYHYDSLGNTSGISKAVNSTIIKNMPFVMPSAGILDDFSNKISPMFDTIRKLYSQIRLLTEARDRLLPRLMGGEMEVDAPKGQRATSIEQRSGHNEQTTNAPKGQKH